MIYDFLLELDYKLFGFLNGLAGHAYALDFLYAVLAEAVIYAMIGGALLLFIFKRKNRVQAIICIEAAAAAFISRVVFVSIVRAIVFRARPFVSSIVIQLVYHNPLEDSFPSGHATVMFAIATSFLLGKPKWLGILFFIFATVSALARVVVGVHFPSDIFAGAIIGIVSSILIKIISVFWLRRRSNLVFQPSGLQKK